MLRRFKPIALVTLSVSAVPQPWAQPTAGWTTAADGPAAMRLSGVVAVAGAPRLAVVEIEGRGGQLLRLGDTLPGDLEVMEIGSDWVRLRLGVEERVLRLTGLPSGSAPNAEAAAALRDGILKVKGELAEEIAAVAGMPDASLKAFADVIGTYLALPPGTEIRVSDLGSSALSSAAEAKAALERSGMLRVEIGSGEQQRTLYLRAEHREGDLLDQRATNSSTPE